MKNRIALTMLAACAQAHAVTTLTDKITFGDAASETAHAVRGEHAQIIQGALGRGARQLLPLSATDWRGGSLEFTLKVDPAVQNYASVRLWGGETNTNKLTLYCEGKQIGYRHLGDIEILDLGTVSPMYEGRFTYRTFPLPANLTANKRQLNCRIRATGPYAVYNSDFAKFQRPMTEPSRPIYAMYVHSDPFLDAGEAEGAAPNAAVRPAPGAEVMEQLQARINREIERELAADRALTLHETLFLARSYDIAWTKAYRNPAVVRKVLEAGDQFYTRYLSDPGFIYSDKTHTNPDWEALGPYGKALQILQAEITPQLDQKLPGSGVTRRDGYAAMLSYGLDYMLHHRRLYTNQSMIVDLLGIYYSNNGLQAIGSGKALPEQQARHYLYESLGLSAWSGSQDKDGHPTYSAASGDNGAFRVPKDYRIFTAAGLSKELGFVGSYGEIQDWATGIYLATRSKSETAGDPQLLQQLVKIAHARSPFRYPAADADGYRAMKLEAPIGWRDPAFPGVTTYVQKTGWDNTPFYTAVATRDPALMAAAQQMLEDNQFFAVLRDRMKDPGQRTTIGLLDAYDEWQVVKNWPRQQARLPMSAGQPDFVFTDTENGVIALKHGDDIMYASLYWRAMCGVNKLFRVHHLTPQADRVATFYGRVDFVPSGRNCTRGNSAHTAGGPIPDVRYPDDAPPALAGEVLPAAQGPADASFERSSFDPYAGRGDYYEGSYGRYLFAMNAGGTKSVELALPGTQAPLKDLVSGKTIAAGTRTLTIAPGQTVILYRP
ncbi:hypothetical protein GJ699_00810 [Duganella sp. FT80W]|uniref:Uncharacterized protein n=1 Tax=Duganella guangzhouensis TaxID=2666084 RepID=A0A6I2KX12_9BURK|nr:hypothetical protein [Duganella guangzhouensis]MRW88519.1 hypothetical protein [Duganella guangzhouensis]